MGVIHLWNISKWACWEPIPLRSQTCHHLVHLAVRLVTNLYVEENQRFIHTFAEISCIPSIQGSAIVHCTHSNTDFSQCL